MQSIDTININYLQNIDFEFFATSFHSQYCEQSASRDIFLKQSASRDMWASRDIFFCSLWFVQSFVEIR